MAQMDSFERSDIKIASKTPGWNLNAWKYLPKAVGTEPKRLPVVVMYGPKPSHISDVILTLL